MPANKTQHTLHSVELYLNGLADTLQKKDSWELYKIMSQCTGSSGVMWGNSIVGFGTYHYTYKTGREGDWFLTGFAPRKRAITLYLMCDLDPAILPFEKLGKYKKGKGCLYIKKLAHVDQQKLVKLINKAISITKKMY
tara:strand:+ start:872 stop:1285 length:414 start_codon:yes stop_codon:yes gene_type:complete